MKYVLIVGVVLAAIVWMLIRFLHRIGEPVNAALSDSYYHHARKNIIVHSPMGNWFELGYYESTADPATFQVLSRDYGRDNKTVFWRGRKQSVDAATFRVDENRIPKDDFRVYDDDHYQDELRVIEGADPKTFRPLTLPSDRYNHRWYRDENAIYAAGKRMDVDAKTFQRLNETLALDANHLYAIVRNPVNIGSGAISLSTKAANPGGDAKQLSDNYAQIGHAIAHSNWIREFSLVFFKSIDSVRLLDERHLAVNGVLISDGQIVDDFDVASFQAVGQYHIRDQARVYYLGSRIIEADAATFVDLYDGYAKDIRHAYYQGRVLTGVNPATFRYEANTGTATDGTVRLKEGQPVK